MNVNDTYPLIFQWSDVRALELLVFTLNHLKNADLALEEVEDGLSGLVEAAQEKARYLAGRMYDAVYEHTEAQEAQQQAV